MLVAWVLLASVALASVGHQAECMPSRQCIDLVSQGLDQAQLQCNDSPCGQLEASDIGMTFTERLSHACKAKMAEFRMPRSGNGRLIQHGQRFSSRCTDKPASANPTNPVVMQTANSAPFFICTVPKVACTNIRKLLRVLIRHPESVPRGADEQMWPAHFSNYATLWHYDHLSAAVDDRMPGFILGRNPYVRILSCHLDKMVLDPNKGHDWSTLKQINWQLGSDVEKLYEATPESFAEFVRQVQAHGPHDINEHLRLQVEMCDPQSVQYSYWLRLEDMAQWLPCFVEGLRLERFVPRGWVTTPLEWVGDDAPGCWWAPRGMSCEEFWAAARDNGTGRLQPVAVQGAVDGKKTLFGHQTGADGQVGHFYTQEIADIVYEMYKPDFEAFGYERLVVDDKEQGAGAGVGVGADGTNASHRGTQAAQQ